MGTLIYYYYYYCCYHYVNINGLFVVFIALCLLVITLIFTFLNNFIIYINSLYYLLIYRNAIIYHYVIAISIVNYDINHVIHVMVP